MTRRALPFLVAFGFMGSVCAEALAQTAFTASIVGTPTRRDGRLPSGIKPNIINYADCAADDKITLKLNTTSANVTLEVWAGTVGDCGNVNRGPATVPTQCWQVFVATPWPTGSISIPVKDILPHNASGPGTAPDTVCDDVANVSTGNGNVTLYFIPVAGQATSGGTAATYAVTYDLQGPTPPTNFDVGLGDTRLIPSWTVSSDRSISGYRLYCQPSETCSSDYLTPGTVPSSNTPDDLRTGSAGPNSTQGEISGLENGEDYVCAIAATDTYGNVGKLSEVACGSPKPVNGYYRVYREAGGTAGGGYCSFGRRASPALAPILFAALAAFALRRRRRGSSA